MNLSTPQLSIIIPAYNEELRLERTLERIREYFSAQPAGMAAVEIVVVDDGSVDGTSRLAQEWARANPSVRLIANGKNRGKGYSVRHGML